LIPYASAFYTTACVRAALIVGATVLNLLEKAFMCLTEGEDTWVLRGALCVVQATAWSEINRDTFAVDATIFCAVVLVRALRVVGTPRRSQVGYVCGIVAGVEDVVVLPVC